MCVKKILLLITVYATVLICLSSCGTECKQSQDLSNFINSSKISIKNVTISEKCEQYLMQMEEGEVYLFECEDGALLIFNCNYGGIYNVNAVSNDGILTVNYNKIRNTQENRGTISAYTFDKINSIEKLTLFCNGEETHFDKYYSFDETVSSFIR